MATSGTTAWAPDILELIEEAHERAGTEMRHGQNIRSARRAIDLLTLEWSNRGLNLWSVEAGTLAITAGDASYSLPTDTIDLLEHQLRTGTGTSQIDYDLYRMSVSTYASITNKNTTGRPSQIYVDRQRAQPGIILWPVPDTDYTLAYHRMRRLQDAGVATNEPDIPPRFLPAFVAGLAYTIAMKTPGQEQRAIALKEVYDQQFMWATEEDRSRASWRIMPHVPGV